MRWPLSRLYATTFLCCVLHERFWLRACSPLCVKKMERQMLCHNDNITFSLWSFHYSEAGACLNTECGKSKCMWVCMGFICDTLLWQHVGGQGLLHCPVCTPELKVPRYVNMHPPRSLQSAKVDCAFPQKKPKSNEYSLHRYHWLFITRDNLGKHHKYGVMQYICKSAFFYTFLKYFLK